MKSFKTYMQDFNQSMASRYDWGTSKATKHALDLTPGQLSSITMNNSEPEDPKYNPTTRQAKRNKTK